MYESSRGAERSEHTDVDQEVALYLHYCLFSVFINGLLSEVKHG